LGDARDGDGEYTGTKWIDMVVDNSQVFLVSAKINRKRCIGKLIHSINKQLDPSGEMHLIDESTANRPAINSTWFIALILSLVHRFAGSRLPRAEKEEYSAQNSGMTTTTNIDVKPNVDSDDGISSDAPDSEVSTFKKGESKVKMPTVKAGGMRRKNLRKR
jgi:DnaJ family protein C protein 1